MYYEILNTLMLLGAIQGVVFSVVAFTSKKFRSRSTFFLGMLILTFSYNIIQNYLVASEIFTLDKYFKIFYIPFSSLFLVLFYLYVKSFLYQDKKLSRNDYLLFIPFFIAFTESVFEKAGFAAGYFDHQHTEYFNYYRIVQEIFNIIYSFFLIFSAYRLIRNAAKEKYAKTSLTPNTSLKWLKTITIILFFLCVYWIVPLYYECQSEIETALEYFYILWIGLSFTIYLLGHIGLYHFGIVQEQKNIHEFSVNSKKIVIPDSASRSKSITAFEKFIKEEKNYLDCNLSLELTAEKLDISKSHLSRIINSELGKNFSDYVNELRVEEAKNYISNPEFSNYTLVAIGLEAGFNSKSAFNSTFKKFTGITPSEYKKTLGKS